MYGSWAEISLSSLSCSEVQHHAHTVVKGSAQECHCLAGWGCLSILEEPSLSCIISLGSEWVAEGVGCGQLKPVRSLHQQSPEIPHPEGKKQDLAQVRLNQKKSKDLEAKRQVMLRFVSVTFCCLAAAGKQLILELRPGCALVWSQTSPGEQNSFWREQSKCCATNSKMLSSMDHSLGMPQANFTWNVQVHWKPK